MRMREIIAGVLCEAETVSLKDGRRLKLDHLEDFDDGLHCFEVFATLDGQMVGSGKYDIDRGEFRRIDVEQPFRRLGIATAIYDYVERLGHTIHPSPHLEPDGEAFWNARRKPLGEANYHGSSDDVPVFRAEHTGTNSHTFGSYTSTRYGVFFTNNPKFAAMYGKVGRYRLTVRHKLDLENDNNTIWDFVHSFDPHNPEERPIWLEAREIMYRNKYWQLFEDEVGQLFVAFLKARGYDSATFTEYNTDDHGKEHRSVTTVVFDPSRVKRLDI